MKRKSHEEHENHERWLLTYADLITLLLGLFVILYAMSKIDVAKYAEVISALGGVFGGGNPSVLQGSTGVVELPVPSTQREKQIIEKEIRTALQLDSKPLPISITLTERGVSIHLMEELLFESGRAELRPSALGALDALAEVLQKLPNDIRVEGHTDNVPIHTPVFISNWHLSVARAVNAAYYLIQKHQLAAEKVSVVGYSEYRPLASNATPEGRARNRRVDVLIVTGTVHSDIDGGPDRHHRMETLDESLE